MSIAGFDFGCQSSRIAIVRSGGVEVICNEVSDRATPSMVSFDPKRRFAGDAAKVQQVSNFRNAVANLPRIIGRLENEELITEVESKFLTCRLTGKEGLAAVPVSYKGQDATFTNVELVSMFLNKLKAITNAETKAPLSDVVISVPVYLTEKERRALCDAAEIAGLKCLKTLNGTTAASVAYGILKGASFDETPEGGKLVVFVDVGYSTMEASIVRFVKGGAQVLGHSFDPNLGGRDFDEVLANYFSENILKKRKVDIRENKKSLLRMRVACDKIKKILSGIQATRLDLEALVEGEDFTLEATRAQLEELSAPLLDRFEGKLVELLTNTGISAESVDSIEIVGGATRIPAIKARIAKVFGREPSTTLNADEAIARGCALQCAVESPLIRTKEYAISDAVVYPIKYVISNKDGVVYDNQVFNAFTPASDIRTLTLQSSLPLTVEAFYTGSPAVPAGIPPQICKFEVSAPKSFTADFGKITLKTRLNGSGFLEITEATVEAEFQEAPTPVEGEDAAPAGPRIVIRTFPLTIKSETFRLPRQTIQSLKEAEVAMTLDDKMVSEIDDRRNAVESFIYESRDKLDSVYAPFMSPEEREQMSRNLTLAEDWLYGEGAELGKEDYIKKLDELVAQMEPFVSRKSKQDQAEEDARKAALAAEKPGSPMEQEPSESPSSSISSEVPTMDMD